MATITIRNLDEKIKRKLQIRAALNGHSMEAEVRQILADLPEVIVANARPSRRAHTKMEQVILANAGSDLDVEPIEPLKIEPEKPAQKAPEKSALIEEEQAASVPAEPEPQPFLAPAPEPSPAPKEQESNDESASAPEQEQERQISLF
jgi:plasmid stability protein